MKREMVQGVANRLTTILKRGTAAAEDRTWLLWNARLLLVTVFYRCWSNFFEISRSSVSQA
jgi:hypothetical protein